MHLREWHNLAEPIAHRHFPEPVQIQPQARILALNALVR